MSDDFNLDGDVTPLLSQQELTDEEWDDIRTRFRESMMVQTEVGKLAQNIDTTWPFKGKDEVPAKYIGMTLAELREVPGMAEKPERIRLLADILRETMAFDDPFGEMAEHVDSSSKRDESALKALQQLQIPPNYPIRICNVSDETKEFCKAENLQTIREFLDFAQNMAQNVVVGGDFRSFLNSFTHKDEKAVARYLPFRPGRRGLHLAEAVNQLVMQCGPEEYEHLRLRYAAEVGGPAKPIRKLSPTEVSQLDAVLANRLQELLTWFSDEALQMRAALREGGTAVERFFMVLENREHEKIARGVAMTALSVNSNQGRGGFFKRLLGR